MDRNLGALKSEIGNAGTNETKYQFGRKDPFPSGSTYNVKGKAVSVISTSSLSSTYTLPYLTKRPVLHSYTADNGGEWCYNHPYGNREWRNTTWYSNTSSKSLFDPCPPGWMVPKTAIFNGIAKSSNNTSWNNGYSFYLSGIKAGDVAWFPATGFRTTSTGIISANSYILLRYSTSSFFLSSNGNINTNSVDLYGGANYGRAVGASIRCVQD